MGEYPRWIISDNDSVTGVDVVEINKKSKTLTNGSIVIESGKVRFGHNEHNESLAIIS